MQYSSIQVFKYTSILVYKYSSILVFKYTSIQVIKSVSLQVYNLTKWLLTNQLINNVKARDPVGSKNSK